jgi:ubiquinone biosynthesis protein COQ4
MNALTHDFVPDSIGGRPFADPRREPARYRPLKALRHFRNLIRDKENTAEVFPIFEALPRRDFVPSARAYIASEVGRKVYATEPELPPILDDHEALRRLPAGTVAHAYCDFMEAEGLTAAGLVEEEARSQIERARFDDVLSWYGRRHRDTHDLLHVLTGYGRDALGEQCVLAFTYSQSPSPAHLFLGYAGAWEIARRLKKVGAIETPIFKAVREAQKLGKACPRVAEMPIREVLAMPLEEARAKFNIAKPHYYHEVHRLWRADGIDPYDLLTAVKEAA